MRIGNAALLRNLFSPAPSPVLVRGRRHRRCGRQDRPPGAVPAPLTARPGNAATRAGPARCPEPREADRPRRSRHERSRHSTMRAARVGPMPSSASSAVSSAEREAHRSSPRRRPPAPPPAEAPAGTPRRHQHLLPVLQGRGEVEGRQVGPPGGAAGPPDRLDHPRARGDRVDARAAHRPGDVHEAPGLGRRLGADLHRAGRRPRRGWPPPPPAPGPDPPGDERQHDGRGHVGPARAAQPGEQSIHATQARSRPPRPAGPPATACRLLHDEIDQPPGHDDLAHHRRALDRRRHPRQRPREGQHLGVGGADRPPPCARAACR